MRTWIATATSLGCRIRKTSAWVFAVLLTSTAAALAQSSGETPAAKLRSSFPIFLKSPFWTEDRRPQASDDRAPVSASSVCCSDWSSTPS